MKVINETDYDTMYLKRLFLECEKYCAFWKLCGPNDKKHREVTVVNKKGGGHAGTAWYNTYSIVMKLPYDPKKSNTHIIAQIYTHEVEHNSGQHHRGQADCFKRRITFWADEVVPTKVKKEKPKISIVAKREKKAREQLKKWETKLKRAKTAVAKYVKQIKYYENKAAITATTKKTN